MIIFLAKVGAEAGLKPLQADPAAPEIRLLRYNEVLGKSQLPQATYIFTNFEHLSAATLTEAARLFRRLQEHGCRVLNDPARVRTRFALLRKLYQAGLNPINVYMAEEGERPSRFPVFIRIADDHRGSLSELLWDQTTLDSAIEAAVVSGLPRSRILIIEYAAEPIRPGVFRKSSFYRVGAQFIPDVWWYGTSWHVKGDREGLAGEELYKDELEAMRDCRLAKYFHDPFSLANIEYGRLDFSFVEGKPCIYEINTYPILFGPRPDAIPERAASLELRWTRLLSAFHEIDSDTASSQAMIDVAGMSINALKQANVTSEALRYQHLRLSREHARRGNLLEALAEAEAEVAARPDSVKPLSHLSRSLKECGRIDDAIAVATKVVDISPRRTRERLHLVELLNNTGQYDLARDRLLEGLALGSEHWKIYFLLAQVRSKFDDDAAALDAANRAAALAPDDATMAECLSQVRQLLVNLERFDNAIDAATRVIELNPQRINDRIHLVNLLRQTGRFEEARSQLVDGIAAHGEHWRLYFLLSHVCYKLGDHPAAREAAMRAITLAPEEAPPQDWLRRLQEERSLFSILKGLGIRLVGWLAWRPRGSA